MTDPLSPTNRHAAMPSGALVPDHEFRYRRWPGWQQAASMVSTVAATALIAIDEKTRPWGIGMLAVLAMMLGWLLVRRVAIRIDGQGLTVHAFRFPQLPWADIDAVRFVRAQDVAYLVVDRTPAARRARPANARIRAFARRIGARDLVVPLVQQRLSDEPKQICEVIALALAVTRRTQA